MIWYLTDQGGVFEVFIYKRFPDPRTIRLSFTFGHFHIKVLVNFFSALSRFSVHNSLLSIKLLHNPLEKELLTTMQNHFCVAFTNSEKRACDLRHTFSSKMSRRSHAFFSELINLKKWFFMVVNNPLSRGSANIAKVYLITYGRSTCSKLKKNTTLTETLTWKCPFTFMLDLVIISMFSRLCIYVYYAVQLVYNIWKYCFNKNLFSYHRNVIKCTYLRTRDVFSVVLYVRLHILVCRFYRLRNSR